MIDLKTPIEKLSHVGPRTLPRLKKLGIKTIGHLLRHFPSRYEDYSQLMPIASIDMPISGTGETVSIQGTITDIKSSVSWKRRRLAITNAIIEDDTGSIRAVWFNQPYIERALPVGTNVNIVGKVSLDKNGLCLSNPSYEKTASATESLRHTGRLVPRYPETEGITSKYLRFLIKPILDQLDILPEPLPETILEKYDLPLLADAYRGIHFPETLEEVKPAQRRFAFEELLLFQLRALQDRKQFETLKAPQIIFDKYSVSEFVKSLPFTLTDDQRLATYEILQDLDRHFPMNRLLNGDVGSGKTVVAMISAYQVVKAGYQVVFMAPTEILARQHFQTMTTIMKPESGIRIGLLTGSEARQWPHDEVIQEKISKKLMVQKIAQGDIDIVIGTHAVIQKAIVFKKLALVIIDEQHRFGVSQRMHLVKDSQDKMNVKALTPHLLSMTATPIPRTLALTIYGDLDVSLIKQKPKGRQRIVTKIVEQSQRKQAYAFIDKEIDSGRQIFVICPRIEVSKFEEKDDGKISISQLLWDEVKAVTEEFEKLEKEIFPHRSVAMLHGKMKAQEKTAIMQEFKDKRFDILVATSVIEVGVDVPNATLMMIESAERFGLAQLHQFRGRVGRGAHQSYCFLFTSSGNASQRLRALEKIDNGFELAETDMKLRGPGEFTGVKQSGLPDLAMASLSDVVLIKQARAEAKIILNDDPTLKKHPSIRERLTEMQKIVHFE